MTAFRLVVLCIVGFSSIACDNILDPSKVSKLTPMLINETVSVSGPNGSNAVIVFNQILPARDSVLKTGESADVWVTVTNNSSMYLGIGNTVSDGPHDNSGERGRDSQLFSISSLRIIDPGQTMVGLIFGFTVRTPEDIPYLRLSGNYHTGRNFQIGPWIRPAWTTDFYLGWKSK